MKRLFITACILTIPIFLLGYGFEDFISEATVIKYIVAYQDTDKDGLSEKTKQYVVSKSNKSKVISVRLTETIDYINPERLDHYSETLYKGIDEEAFKHILNLLASDELITKLKNRKNLTMSSYRDTVVIQNNGIELSIPYYGYFYSDIDKNTEKENRDGYLSDPPLSLEDQEEDLDKALKEVISIIMSLGEKSNKSVELTSEASPHP